MGLMSNAPLPAGLEERVLGADEEGQVQRLLEACDDYHQLLYGRSAWPTAARELLAELPPGLSASAKFAWGYFRGDELVLPLEGPR